MDEKNPEIFSNSVENQSERIPDPVNENKCAQDIECLNEYSKIENDLGPSYNETSPISKTDISGSYQGELNRAICSSCVTKSTGQSEVQDILNNEVTCNPSSTQPIRKPSFNFNCLKMITGAWTEFNNKEINREIFLKGCKWSPDGTCLLTNSDDGTMRLFDLPLALYNCHSLRHREYPELQATLRTKIGGLVYDYCWYPLMSSTNPTTCCFLTTSFCAPVQLWDAFSGELRCSYRGYNAQDELHAALSVAFHPTGSLLLCGYKDNIKIFHTDMPGRSYTSLSTKGLCEQRGIVSCIAVNPSLPNIFAAGTYSKTVGLYSMDGHGMCLLTGQSGGLTQLVFSQDGSRLFAAGRKDSEILCWDLRQLGQVLFTLRRPHTTNQRIYFDLSSDDQYLLSGSSDGNVRVWDLQTDSDRQPLAQWRAHNDCVNGLSVHKHIPVVATASGQRYIPDIVEGDEDCVFPAVRPQDKYEDSVKLWWMGHIDENPTDEQKT